MTEQEQRAAVVREALSWERTPFHDCAGVKGIGTDCANLPFKAYKAAGLIPEGDTYPPYTAQWLLHSEEERFLEIVDRYAVQIEGPPLPGDLAMFFFGRCFGHGAIVVAWPIIIHAHKKFGAVYRDDFDQNTELQFLGGGKPRPRRFYTLKAWVK